MRYCKNCGLLAPLDADRCPQCGAPLPAVPAPQAPQAAQPPHYDRAPDEVPALSEWDTLGMLLLFAIPFVGFFFSLAWSFFSKNPARKRLSQAWLIRTLVVLVIAALICLWLALNSALAFSIPQYYYAY